MKTSETLPGPLASAHTVPNHKLLLTPKRTTLIGAIVENLMAATGSPNDDKVWGSFARTGRLSNISSKLLFSAP